MEKIVLQEGITLHVLQTPKFKNAMISFSFLDSLDETRNTKNALLPYVLQGGCEKWENKKKLNQYLENLYGATLFSRVRKKGETQAFGFGISFLEKEYALEGENMLACAFDVLEQVILKPRVEENSFDAGILALEKTNLKDRIAAQINDKRSYATHRCVEEMCKNQPFALSSLGQSQDVDKIDGAGLYEHYKQVLKSYPVEIYYVGSEDAGAVAQALKTMFLGVQREAISLPATKIFAPISGEKRVDDAMDVAQCKLSLGFFTGMQTDDKDYMAMVMLCSIFGGGPTSKLFMNVREKLSLCYYASARMEKQKGMILVSSGIEEANKEVALHEILNQLTAIQEGDITEEEFEAARASQLNAYESLADSPYSCEDFALGENLCPKSRTPEQYQKELLRVTKEDVVRVSKQVGLHTIYTLS